MTLASLVPVLPIGFVMTTTFTFNLFKLSFTSDTMLHVIFMGFACFMPCGTGVRI